MSSNKNINDDLKIHGKASNTVAAIKRPREKSLSIEGTVDFVSTYDQVDKNLGGILVDGVDIAHHSAPSKEITLDFLNLPGQTEAITGSDPSNIFVKMINTTGNPNKNMIIQLPFIDTLKGKRKYTFHASNGDKTKESTFHLRCSGYVESGNADSIDGVVELVKTNSTTGQITLAWDNYLTIESEVGSYPSIGSGNCWHITSGNIHELLYANVMSSANVATPTTTLVHGATVDSKTLVNRDIVLLTAQTDPIENGPYVVGLSGTNLAVRHHTFPTGEQVKNRIYSIVEGTIHAGKQIKSVFTDHDEIIGTDAVSFQDVQGVKVDVQQITSPTTTVSTEGGDYGVVTTMNQSLAAGSALVFRIMNSKVVFQSTVLVTMWYGGTWHTNGLPMISTNPDAGFFDIKVINIHASNALNGEIGISYLIKN